MRQTTKIWYMLIEKQRNKNKTKVKTKQNKTTPPPKKKKKNPNKTKTNQNLPDNYARKLSRARKILNTVIA